MSIMSAQIERLRQSWTAGDNRLVLTTYTGTLFLSALLLFSVQPMFARMVLPKLGGSPSVWAVSMCFFQAVLLAGYCYAHVLSRYLSARLVPFVHLTVLATAMLALPIGLSESRAEPPAGDAYGWLIVTLTLGVGFPFFAVSANAPLLQAWFARTGHPHAGDPYFLYGASNFGSLVALLAYPIVVEPFSGLTQQAAVWAVGFVALAVMIALCGAMMIRALSTTSEVTGGDNQTDAAPLDAEHPTIAQRLGWIGLAFVPSGLLVAFTSYVTTDIASAPFLWVLPLAIFLATFILVFRDRPVIPHRWLLFAQAPLTTMVLIGISADGSGGWMIAAVGGTFAFFVATMVCHRELFEHRPATYYLTEFYLWTSLGGVLGGVFAALIAPQIFNAVWEYPLLLTFAMACRPEMLTRPSRQETAELIIVGTLAITAVAALAVLYAHGVFSSLSISYLRTFVLFTLGCFALLPSVRTPAKAGYMAIAAFAVVALPSAMNKGDSERSFFGTHRVVTSADGKIRFLLHGTTMHGADRLFAEDGSPTERVIPMTYYHPQSPMALGAKVARTNHVGPTPFSVGIVGLGAGAMACNSRSEEYWRFYEIDPVVVSIARDPKKFRFLSSCRPNADILLGDARLSLSKEPTGRFDYILIDAFSSDSIPVHLLTVEAVRLYLDKLSPNGLLALHVSNRHLDLISVANAVAAAIPGTHVATVVDLPEGRGYDATPSMVVMIGKSHAAIAPVLSWTGLRIEKAVDMRPWTDDYSNILAALWRKYRGH